MKSPFCFVLLMILKFSLIAQDTVSVMAYNILNYNSATSDKTRYNDLKTIIAYAKPDAVLLSEVVDNTAAQLLLDSAFNVAGVGTYSRSAFMNGPDTDNMLYYKTSKLKLKSQLQIGTSLRDISQYYVYHVIVPGDTAWMYLHSAHLKAGSAASDISQRGTEVTTFCSAISTISATKNVLIAGDFNFYNNSETAWNVFTTSCSHIFYDPINQAGNWSNNSAYKFIHTQSTRTSGSPGCCGGATGGIDDRFDFIITNGPLMNGTNKVQVIPSTYKSIGNDGNHMNLAINAAPTNTAVSSVVAQALFNMSDHLPVFTRFKITPLGSGIQHQTADPKITLKVSSELSSMKLNAFVPQNGEYHLTVINTLGSKILEKRSILEKGTNDLTHLLDQLQKGIYVILLTGKDSFDSCLFPLNTVN